MSLSRASAGMQRQIGKILSSPIVGGGRKITYRRKDSNAAYDPTTSIATPDTTDIKLLAFRAKVVSTRKNRKAGAEVKGEWAYNIPVKSLCDPSAGFIRPTTADEIIDGTVTNRIVKVEGDSLETYWRVFTVTVDREDRIGA